jgi:ribonuclease BN (tRNA processing enzyme)
MKIRVLGCTGNEFPGHNLPSLLLDHKIIFDAGSLTNVLDEKKQLRIQNILITHAHLDHTRGIPFLADNIIVGNSPHRVTLFSIPPVAREIKKNLLNSSVWPDFTEIPNLDDGILKIVTLKIDNPVEVDGYTITPYKVNHPVPAVGYLVEDRKMRRFFYTGDTGPTSGTWKKLKGRLIHCLIIDVSFPNAMKDIAIRTGHLTPALLENELSKMDPPPKKVYITHIKTQWYKSIRAELEWLRMKNLHVLQDGYKISV